MSQKIERFLKRNNIAANNIKYIIRENGKTVVHRIDGATFETYNTVKEFKETLPEDEFIYPTKGVIASIAQIVNIKNGNYEMSDGKIFRYRLRNSPAHDNHLMLIGRKMEQMEAAASQPLVEQLSNSFIISDKLPIPFCIVELKFDVNGGGSNFYMRYANRALIEYFDFCEGDNVDDESLLNYYTEKNVIGKPFFEVFPFSSKKWFAFLADVALNGTPKYLDETFSQSGDSVRVCCYQLNEGYIACLLSPHPKLKDNEN